MYAIITTGGKQHKATVGEVLQIEKLPEDIGQKVEFDQVLLVVDGEKIAIGTPCLAGAKVIGEISEQKRGEKINIIKFRRRKHYMRHQGHRQYYTAVKIAEIKS